MGASANRGVDLRRFVRLLAVGVPSLAAATIAVGLLGTDAGVQNAAIVYLAAVVATAIVAGVAGAILVAVASFLLYDFFFTAPYHTLRISDPGERLSVVLLLFVGIVVGQLAGSQRSRAEEDQLRHRQPSMGCCRL